MDISRYRTYCYLRFPPVIVLLSAGYSDQYHTLLRLIMYRYTALAGYQRLAVSSFLLISLPLNRISFIKPL